MTACRIYQPEKTQQKYLKSSSFREVNLSADNRDRNNERSNGLRY
jgi:hypothetical protein